MLSLQAAQEAQRQGDRERRITFYLMAAIVALVGVGLVGMFALSSMTRG